ncbi:Oxidoreductase FAD-binding domain protein [Kribbella flavida DSM 17836]|uniref:nitric oxide dioxygenase n=1 Tax=Kribbella flavida (strain DSM 17836 / JCM 10339 / NBRC 14399) TaxID=479435 RepID=D2Q0K7_KRIFD|nr:globin domain-containing protein [Kribbella flavida]ADB33807.1 Oxidoreductase FAD-binding domain protein [Kribbella flavida DSM 17836]
MDPAALKSSWDVVAKAGDEVPMFFYSHLFLSHPEVREMFPVSMAAQRDKLVGALGAVVSNAAELDKVVPFLQQLGRDHRRFSVIAEHYSAVGASLLATLQHFLGAAWTQQLAADWAEAYGLVAAVMVQAADESAEETPAWWPAEVLGVDRRTMDITIVQLRPEEPVPYQPGQSLALEIPYRPRRWRYFSPANAPRPDGSIELHIQLVPGGQVSGPAVRSLKKGDPVRLGAPVGDALLLPEDGRDLLMVAGGTGLAPLRAMLEQLDRRTVPVPRVHLFHGARMPWNLYEHAQLTRLTQRPWFSYTPVVSDDASYPGRRGPVGSVAAEHGPWTGHTVLVCGSSPMVAHTVDELRAAGVPAADIRTETFGSSTTTSTTAGGPQ